MPPLLIVQTFPSRKMFTNRRIRLHKNVRKQVRQRKCQNHLTNLTSRRTLNSPTLIKCRLRSQRRSLTTQMNGKSSLHLLNRNSRPSYVRTSCKPGNANLETNAHLLMGSTSYRKRLTLTRNLRQRHARNSTRTIIVLMVPGVNLFIAMFLETSQKPHMPRSWAKLREFLMRDILKFHTWKKMFFTIIFLRGPGYQCSKDWAMGSPSND